MNARPDYDAIIVGAGFAGMYMLYRLMQQGLTVRVIEKGADLGGTWYWNRYPGARCDIESVQYSYSFSEELQQQWDWSERYATQSEILLYANHVAEKFNLRQHMQFDSVVERAVFNGQSGFWQIGVRSSEGIGSVTSRFCIMATGCLSTPNKPIIEALDAFQGEVYHTANWPETPIDFSQQNVALVGTGSSGIQTSVALAPIAKQLTIFQRTPNYVVPDANHALDAKHLAEVRQNYTELRKHAKRCRNGVAQEIVEISALDVSHSERVARYQHRWEKGGLTFIGAFADLIINEKANNTVAEFVRQKIRATVNNADTATLLSPTSTFGCKRLCVSSGYYEIFNRHNVALVDASEGIACATEHGLIVADYEYHVDSIILATGFDAMTGTLNRIEIIGKQGQTLKNKWRDGPSGYLGLMVSGFPNLFTITGPGSPSVLSNVLTSIEYHVQWIADCMQYMTQQNYQYIEPQQKAEDEWAEEVGSIVNNTLYRTCDSWYLGSNVAGKPRKFMPYPGVPSYESRCSEIAKNDYQGFTFYCDVNETLCRT